MLLFIYFLHYTTLYHFDRIILLFICSIYSKKLLRKSLSLTDVKKLRKFSNKLLKFEKLTCQFLNDIEKTIEQN